MVELPCQVAETFSLCSWYFASLNGLREKKIQPKSDILIVSNFVTTINASVIANELVWLERDSCCLVYHEHITHTNGAGLLWVLALVFSCYVNSYNLWIQTAKEMQSTETVKYITVRFVLITVKKFNFSRYFNVQNQSFLSFKLRLQLQSTNKLVLYSFKSCPYLVIWTWNFRQNKVEKVIIFCIWVSKRLLIYF